MDFKPFAQELGIDKMPEDKQESMYRTLLDTLEMRMSQRLANELTEEQQKQLEEAVTKGDAATMAMLEQVYPNIQQTYQEELDKLKEEYKIILPMIQ